MTQLTILSARFANADHTAAAVETQERGWKIASEADTPELWPAVLAANPSAYANDVNVHHVVEERKRRLALGFDYDFQDARGVHHIGTTADDMVGWREVIDYANALVDLGDTSTSISIVTDTGPTLVTAPEWQAVMLQAAQVRQVIWAKSFALQAMSPIPSDYENDSYWT